MFDVCMSQIVVKHDQLDENGVISGFLHVQTEEDLLFSPRRGSLAQARVAENHFRVLQEFSLRRGTPRLSEAYSFKRREQISERASLAQARRLSLKREFAQRSTLLSVLLAQARSVSPKREFHSSLGETL